MRKETRAMGIVLALVLALVLSITSTGVAQAASNPVRDMPESVEAGADFKVTVTWTAPADSFNAIGLTDTADATANMAVSGDKHWCTPNADQVKIPANNIIEYLWFGPYNNGTEFTAVYSVHVPTRTPEGEYTFDGNLLYYIGGAGPYTEDITGDPVITIEKPKAIFDTDSPENPYPSIFGIHNGTIMSNHTITISKLYTYPCPGTGGHSEYTKIYNDSWSVETLPWEGYKGDWHNLSFKESFKLYAGVEYNYTIITGSYPQIHHNKTLTMPDGEITCTKFIDANGRVYYDWIPAIRLGV